MLLKEKPTDSVLYQYCFICCTFDWICRNVQKDLKTFSRAITFHQKFLDFVTSNSSRFDIYDSLDEENGENLNKR